MGWGHFGTGDAVMPGQGRVVERSYTPEERAVLGERLATLGETTFDVYLNARAFWRNIPASVWRYKLRSSLNFPVKSPYGSPRSVKLLIPPTCLAGEARCEAPRLS